jgi:hypothetical protein
LQHGTDGVTQIRQQVVHFDLPWVSSPVARPGCGSNGRTGASVELSLRHSVSGRRRAEIADTDVPRWDGISRMWEGWRPTAVRWAWSLRDTADGHELQSPPERRSSLPLDFTAVRA